VQGHHGLHRRRGAEVERLVEDLGGELADLVLDRVEAPLLAVAARQVLVVRELHVAVSQLQGGRAREAVGLEDVGRIHVPEDDATLFDILGR
jgi:hypothetical protein